MTKQIKVTQVRSAIGRPGDQRQTLVALGLRGIGKQRVHKDNNCVRGMINKVAHLVRYELEP